MAVLFLQGLNPCLSKLAAKHGLKQSEIKKLDFVVQLKKLSERLVIISFIVREQTREYKWDLSSLVLEEIQNDIAYEVVKRLI